MKSTTGAYGDFPDHYYEAGNQFGSYLLGKTAPMSFDTRKELETLEGGFSVIRLGRGENRRSIPANPHDVLMEYVRAKVKAEDVAYVLSSLASARGVSFRVNAGADPYAELDSFLLEHLTSDEELAVLKRLREAIREGEERARKRLPNRAKKAPGKPRRRRNNGRKRKRAAAPSAASSSRFGPNRCGICGRSVSETERSRCQAEPGLFHGHVYCSRHAIQLRQAVTNSA